MRVPFPLPEGRYPIVAHYCRTRRVEAAGKDVQLVFPGGERRHGVVYSCDLVEAWGFTIETWRASGFAPLLQDLVFLAREQVPPPWVVGRDPTPTDLELVVWSTWTDYALAGFDTRARP